ncbi:MAG: hypothetical protein JXR73_16035 [Candidatus Omnitrophica bacterium]|nr:hypothetical protein [Candidatus Omnitrophota bacterium]
MFKSSILSCLVVVSLTSGAFAGDLLIRGAAAIPDGTEIEFSIPVQVIEALKTSGLSAIVKDKDRFNELVDGLIGDLCSLEGESLLEVEMDGCNVQISVDEVDDDNPVEANFVQFDIDPAGENQPDIEFRIPKGCFFMAAFLGNQFMESHGKEIMDMVQKQIMMNAMPPAPPKPAAPPEKPDYKKPPREKERKEMKDDDEDDDEEECEKEEIRLDIEKQINPEEIHKHIMKEINPDKIHKLILEAILKELK